MKFRYLKIWYDTIMKQLGAMLLKFIRGGVAWHRSADFWQTSAHVFDKNVDRALEPFSALSNK